VVHSAEEYAAGRHRVGTAIVDGIEALILSSGGEGGIEARFAPGAGMVGCALIHRGEQLLGTRDGLGAYVERHSTMGIPLLAPWANRLEALEFELAGRRVSLDPGSPRLKLDGSGLPIHGLLTAARGWRVTAHEADSGGARLTAELAFEEPELVEAFPFPHRLELAAELRDSTLTIALTATAGEAGLPIAFGFHPYLQLPGLPRAEWEVSAPVEEHLPLDERGLPTGERQPADVAPGPLGDRRFDDAFTADTSMPFVLAGGGRRIELALLRGYPFCQLYAPGGELLAFEPMTAPTNALVSGDGLRVIAAGTSFEARFSVSVAT
jgi:galactose mutarotase-like enzyme